MTSTEYSNRNKKKKKNEQSVKLLNKYKEKYLNVEKKCVINKKNYFNKSVFPEGVKEIYTVA